jgi:putative DNA primase/helicase
VFEHTATFLGRLDGVVKTGNGWDARCPCRNDDSNPSMSVHEKQNGQILVYCHRGNGCNAAQICDAVGVPISDLMPPESLASTFDNYPEARPYSSGNKREKKRLKFVAEYNYLDENRKLVFQKRRFVDENGKKTFRQRRPDGMGGWIGYLGDIPKILYNLPNVLEAKAKGEEIWVVEGEKDADTLNGLGVVATTMPNGAGGWLDIHTEALAGATVLIVADNDETGRQHAAHVLEELTKAG